MKSIDNWPVVVLGLCLIGMALAAVAWREAGWIGPCATALTGAVVLWYTFETQQLRKIADEQLKMSEKSIEATRKLAEDAIQPMLMFSTGADDNGAFREVGSRLFLRNLGNGAAFNVCVDPLGLLGGQIEIEVPSVLDKNRHVPVCMKLKVNDVNGEIPIKSIDDLRAQWSRYKLQTMGEGMISYVSGSSTTYGTRWCPTVDENGVLDLMLDGISKIDDIRVDG